MRGEHVVGTKARKRKPERLEESRRRLAAMHADIPAGLTLGAIKNDGAERSITGTSIFDPVLAELIIRWFCPPAGAILDPFAGGSVRGIVAHKLGRSYTGIDLSERQLAANRVQAEAIFTEDEGRPNWIAGDSRCMDKLLPARAEFDLVFSCPPYADLEVYSDNPADLSAMDFEDFLAGYQAIIAASIERLKADRFAAFVVGDARGTDGFYYGLPWRTVEAFEMTGALLYNEAVLVTAAGSLPIRAGKQFEASRKLGKTHQNVLVFCKGDPKAATAALGACEFGELDAAMAGANGGGDPAAAFGDIL